MKSTMSYTNLSVPYLAIHDDKDLIVLVIKKDEDNETFSGVVLWTKNVPYYKIGEINEFDTTIFDPFYGIITLEQ